jgi:hypothetical protein
MIDKLIKKKADDVETKEEKKFGLDSFLKRKGDKENTESVEEKKEKKGFGFKKEFNFSFKLKGKNGEETRQTNPVTRHPSLVTSSELYEKPRQVIAKLFGEDQVDSIMDELIKSVKTDILI